MIQQLFQPVGRTGGDPQRDRFRALRVEARALVAGVIAAGVAALVWASASLRFEQPGLFLELLALAVFGSTVRISLPVTRGGTSLSLSFAITIASMLLLGTGEAVLIGMASAWSQCTFRPKARNPVHRTLFSIATVGVAVWAAGLTFTWVRGGAQGFLLGTVRPLAPAAIAYFLVNTWLVAGAVALSTRERLLKVWRSSFMWSAPGYFAAAATAALAALVMGHGSLWWGVLPAVPLYLTYRSYREFVGRIDDERMQVRQLNEVQLATIEALALAIEVKDRTSQAHVRRIQVYAEGLARAMNLAEEEVRGVKTAALLHDIGNLAVPEHILGKPGALTYEEFQKVKIHPRVGADIVQSVPFPYPVAPLILAHHERWDGSGYPNGLKGEAIPIGARLLAVVDFYSALLHDRPYRSARPPAEAVAILRENAGTKLDPALVARFVAILPQLDAKLEQEQVTTRAMLSRAAGNDGAAALADIAGAHREAQVLYEIAQVLGTTLGLEETLDVIAAKLQPLLPFDACALFLGDADGGPLRCRHATGALAGSLRHLSASSLTELAAQVPEGDPAGPEAGVRLPSVLVNPLLIDGRPIGALAVYRRGNGAFHADHRRLLDMVAQQAASVFHNAEVFERAHEASLTDPLTGLANRRALQASLGRELSRAERQRSSFALIMLDLDGLKYLNDTFGHHVGDRAIVTVAHVLRSMLRPYDLCARYAGDEFVAVLWDCDLEQAEFRRRELQEAIAMAEIEVAPARTLHLAMSAGAALYPDDGEDEAALVSVADQRMYRDKAFRKRRGLGPDRATPAEPLAVRLM